MTFLIDGLDVSPYVAYKGFKWTRNDIDGPDAGRTMDGMMHRLRVATKIRLDITCRPLTTEETRILLPAILPEYVNVTYDDPTNENPGKRVNDRKTHKYCFVTSAEILRNHKIDPKMPFIPKCVATEYNYYVQTGLYLRRYSLEAVRQMLRTHFTPERFEFRCADRSVFEAAKKSLITNREAFKLLPGKKIAYDDVPGLNLIVLFFS